MKPGQGQKCLERIWGIQGVNSGLSFVSLAPSHRSRCLAGGDGWVLMTPVPLVKI